MKNLLFVLIVLTLAMCIMAPGPGCPNGVCPTKEPTQPPPPTEPPPPPPTEPPQQPTEPPVIITEPPTFPTEPVVFTEVAPKDQPTRWVPDTDKFKNASLPKSGYGSQSEPARVDLVCGLGSILLMLVISALVLIFR